MAPSRSQWPDHGLGGSRAIVFGAGPGMGLSCIEALARAGCDVACVDIEPSVADAAAGVADAVGVRGLPFVADVRDAVSLRAALDGAAEQLGGLDIVLNIVGIAEWAALDDMPDEHWDRAFEINVRHVFLTMREALPHLRRQGGGSMVFLSSINGVGSSPGTAAYGATKAAVTALTRSAAVEFAPHGVRVNAVAPGVTRTPRIAYYDEGEMGERVRAQIPLGRIAEPSEIANAAVFLASPLAAYITGQTLVVDGGLTARYPLDT